MDNRGTTVRTDETPLDREAAQLKRVWRSWDHQVMRLYRELQQTIGHRDAAERAYNLAAHAAKISRTDAAGFALAVLGLVS